MKQASILAAALAVMVMLTGCASSYGPEQISGGYRDKDLGSGVVRVSYFGNGYTTAETVQTFWLYHCAELALAKGYEGFRILSPINLSAVEILKDQRSQSAQIFKVHSGGGGYVVFGYSNQAAKPSLTADIQLIRKPFTPVLAKVFDATELKATLEPYVKGKLCGTNVCPHVHSYIYGAPQPSAPS